MLNNMNRSEVILMKKKTTPAKAYDPKKEAEEVLTVKSQYVSGEKYNSMPVTDENSLKEQ
jgi:hypothetical protein